MSMTDLNVPDIGDVTEVDVIEVLIQVGDRIDKEDSLVTVESDKASMEIPASHAGEVKEVLVKVGDKVSEGTTLARIEAAEAADQPETSAPESSAAPEDTSSQNAGDQTDDHGNDSAPAPSAAEWSGQADTNCDVVVIGAGPGGYSAAFRAADLGLDVVLVERYDTLGGVCLNVGCIPSKALLHTVGVMEAAQELSRQGIDFGSPSIDLDALRIHKDKVVGKLTSGLAGMARARKVKVLTGSATFLDDKHVQVSQNGDATQVVGFGSAIIAAGSQSIQLPFLPDDDRVVDSTGALELPSIPENMLVVGGGIIGLEMATVYSALGSRIDVVEMQDSLMAGPDRDLVKIWQKHNKHRFDRVMLSTRTTQAEAKEDGIHVTFEGDQAPEGPQRYDVVLQAVGRRPNGQHIGADKAGVSVSDDGFIAVDTQMRTNVANIYAIGDIVGQPMLAHKAVHEAHVAAEAIAGEKSFFDARVIPSVAYTDPEVAWVGLTEHEAAQRGEEVTKGVFPWAASGRAIANTRDEGVTKLLFDAKTQRIVGGAIVGTNAGDMIGEIALAIEMGADKVDLARTIHPHPTLGESIGMAAQAADGTCTDLPPVKKR